MNRFSVVAFFSALSSLAVGCEQLIGADFSQDEQDEPVATVPPNDTVDPGDEVDDVSADDAVLNDVPPNDAPTGLCEPGSARCTGIELQICAETADKWRTIKNCATAELCSTSPPMCGEPPPPPPCIAGQLRCDEASLETCDGATGAWMPKEACATPGRCSTATASCAPTNCKATDVQCSANQLVECEDGAWRVRQACSPNELCDAAAGGCRTCVPDVGLCLVDLLYRCASDGSMFTLEHSCPPGSCTAEGCAVTGDAGVSRD
jgi:hypothetical protein